MSNDGQAASIVESASCLSGASRHTVVAELESIGVNPSLFTALTVDQLSNLLHSINRVINSSYDPANNPQNAEGRDRSLVSTKRY